MITYDRAPWQPRLDGVEPSRSTRQLFHTMRHSMARVQHLSRHDGEFDDTPERLRPNSTIELSVCEDYPLPFLIDLVWYKQGHL
jgi:hypothetical protein